MHLIETSRNSLMKSVKAEKNVRGSYVEMGWLLVHLFLQET